MAPSKTKPGIPPPPPPPAPKPKATNTSPGGAFNAFINAHPTMRPYADLIYKWSKVYGTDPVVMAGLYWKESFAAAKAQGKDPSTIESPTGAGVGIGQINPIHVGEKTPWGGVVSQSDLTNPQFNVRWSTWYFSQQIKKYGDVDAAYSKGYNPGYTGPALTSTLPKGYVPRAGLSPTDKASVGVETAGAKQTLTDPWVVLTPKGQFKFVNAPTAPKNTVQYGGTPITRSQFNTVWKQTYADTFFAYTGRQAKPKEIEQILGQAPSVYTLGNQLAAAPSFANSPVYKKSAPGLVQYARTILGNNWKPSGGIIRQAIAQNWDQATFYAHLKQTPAYQQGPEFRDNLAKNRSVFEAVYGNQDQHDPKVALLIKQKTLAGWTPDELQMWLRAQPAYKTTPEYQSKMISFQQQLGLITGQQATLSAAQVDKLTSAGSSLVPTPPPPAGVVSSNHPPANPPRPDNRPGPRTP